MPAGQTVLCDTLQGRCSRATVNRRCAVATYGYHLSSRRDSLHRTQLPAGQSFYEPFTHFRCSPHESPIPKG